MTIFTHLSPMSHFASFTPNASHLWHLLKSDKLCKEREKSFHKCLSILHFISEETDNVRKWNWLVHIFSYIDMRGCIKWQIM